MVEPEVDTIDEALAVERFEAISKVHESMRMLIYRFGTNKNTLSLVRAELVRFAKECGHLFPIGEFPIATGNKSYTIQHLAYNSQTDSEYLYLSSHAPGRLLKPHNHNTYAITAGLAGCEENVLYEKTQSGVPILAETGRVNVELGSGLACGEDDIHSIRVLGFEPTRTFRFYGKSLSAQDRELRRTFYDLDTNKALRMMPDDTFEPI